MMKLNFGFSQRSMPTFLSILVIGGIFGFYLLVHVPLQRQRVIQKNFKELSKSAEFIGARYKDFIKSNIQIANAQNIKGLSPYCNALNRAVNLNSSNIRVFDEFYVVALTANNEPICADDDFFSIEHPDSLYKVEKGIVTAGMKEIVISEVPYLLFADKKSVDTTQYKGISEILYCGFISKHQFNVEVREVNSWILINAAMLVLILIMALPILKLIVLSPIERLYRFNVFWLGLSIILGVGLIMLFFISVYLNINSNEKIDKEINSLADSVAVRFSNEVGDAYDLLEKYDSMQLSCKTCDVGQPDQFYKDDEQQIEFVYDSVRNNNPKFISLYWINDQGIVETYISKDKNQRWGYPVTSRKYFRQIIEDRTLKLNGDGAKPFGFESIVSWRTGKHLAIVTKATDVAHLDNAGDSIQMKVIAVSSYFNSVMDPLLNVEMEFAIMDKEGEVWFHSRKENNLNENFIEEVDKKNIVQNALTSRVVFNERINYRNNDAYVYIKPIENFPLSVAAIKYTASERQANIQIIAASTTIFIFTLLLLAFQFILLLLMMYKRTKLKMRRFYIRWLLPDRADNKRFYETLFCNLLLIGFLSIITIVYYIFEEKVQFDNDAVFILVITQLYLFPLMYYILNRAGNSTDTNFKSQKDDYKANAFVNTSGFLILVLNVLYFVQFESTIYSVLIYQLVLGFIIYWIINRANSKLPNFGFNQLYALLEKRIHRPYPLFLFTWLVLSTMFPIFYFYKFSANAARAINMRFEQAHIANEYDDRIALISGILQYPLAVGDNVNDDLLKNGYYHGNHYSINEQPYHQGLNSSSEEPSKITLEKYYTRASNLLTNQTEMSSASIMPYSLMSAEDGSWTYTKATKDFNYDGSNKKISIRNLKDNTGNRRWNVRMLFISLFIVALWLIYKLLTFSINRIFVKDYENFILQGDRNFDFLKNRDQNRRIFLTRVEHASSEESLDKYVDNLTENGVNYIRVNLRKLLNAQYVKEKLELVKNASVIIYKNFEYLSNDHSYWQKKKDFFDQVESIDNKKEKQVVISSQQHPLIVTTYYETMLEKSTQHRWSPEFRKEYEEYRVSCSQWRKFFDTYVKLSEPIKNEKDNYHPDHQFEELEVKEFIREELGFGTFLRKLEPLIYDYYKELKKRTPDVEIEDLVLKIQSLAEPYYYSLWSSLNKQERFLVFDLAIDGFINGKNNRGIYMLMEKGLLIYDNNLKLFNKSFNNFILSVVDASTEWEMQKEVRKNGSWSATKGVLFVVVIGVFGFIALTSPEILKNFNAILGAVLAMLSLMLRSSTLLSVGK